MEPLGRNHFLLDPEVAHLNHGSFGTVPRPVLAARWAAAEAIEASPERHYRALLYPALAAVRAEVAALLAVEPAALALVENASEAMQIVLATVDPKAGAEILLSDHAYPWVRAAVERHSLRRGAELRTLSLPLTPAGAVDAGRLVDALRYAIGPRTSLLVLDHITSASALLLPLREVLTTLPPGLAVAIDAAHAPGLLPAPVPEGAAFWFGNLHKWAFAPRGSAALVVAPDWRSRVHPLVASARADDGYPAAFDYLGTQDTTPFLAVPAALAFPRQHLGLSFEGLRKRNHALLTRGLERLTETLPVSLGPDNGLPMRTLSWGESGGPRTAAALAEWLRDSGVEVAVVSLADVLHIRVSVQAYVGLGDFERLERALSQHLGRRTAPLT
jgi:isopenicillin-N epimerase